MGPVKIYVAAVEALTKNETQDETQFPTKIVGNLVENLVWVPIISSYKFFYSQSCIWSPIMLQLAVIALNRPDFMDNSIISGGSPEASKRNLNFQSATWHHLKHLQIKDFFSRSIIICKLNPNHYHVIATAVAAAEDLVLGFTFSCCHKLYKPLLNGCVMTYWLPATSRQAFVCSCPLHSRQWRLLQTSKPIDTISA